MDVDAEDPFDPRPDPSGRRIAYVAGGALRVVDVDGANDRELASDPDPDVSWGLAEFVAAEEMERQRGLLVVPRRVAARGRPRRRTSRAVWHIAAPVDPEAPSRPVRYPGAGTDNAVVTLAIVDLDGGRVDVAWDRDAFPYLVKVVWNAQGPLTAAGGVARSARRCRSCGSIPTRARPSSSARITTTGGSTSRSGVPAWLPDGRLVRTRGQRTTPSA